MALDTVKFPCGGNLQPGLVQVVLKLTGTGASAPTAAASSDNDNRIVSAVLTRNAAAGDYTIPLSMVGRVLVGAVLTVTGGATNGLVLGSAVLSGSNLTIKCFDPDTGNAADLANGDVAHLILTFKNSGA